MNALDLDTSLVTALREHLLGLAHQSLPPVHGGRPAQQGSPEEDAVMTRFRPFAELLVLVAAADGRIDDIERAVILGAFRALTGRRVRGATLEALETELRERFHETDPLDALERVCASLAGDRRDAELALQLAGAVAMADLKADPSELELIGTLASWLSIPTRRLGEILSGPSSSE